MREEFTFKGCDRTELSAYCWKTSDDPRAVVQIIHGMCEHASRYARIAGYLNERGFTVYADDHRGHGRSAMSAENVGYIGPDGFNRIVEDEYVLTSMINAKHHGLPVFILAHSFGSFVAQEYITRYGGSLSGVILSGSAMKNGPDVKAGAILALIAMLSGERKQNHFIDKLCFGSYTKRIKDPKSSRDWLSRDEEEVAGYMADPMCGFVCTTNFFRFFFKGLAGLYKKDKLKRIPGDLPILIASGDCDPVGGYGSSPEKLYHMYERLGLKDITLKLYQGARHEILNETNRDEVSCDMASWMEKHMKRQE